MSEGTIICLVALIVACIATYIWGAVHNGFKEQ